ncbi:MAG TPA: extracellular matrix/biofilm biosynthesis regulator RemA family protein [Candidatus Krumholzibacteriaceae bacterium]|nr:extracellular matrix/biofilm biosynthesis regulator RemA family protein [Candidatus Krumholzibacteriaceae bacterium]
MLNVGFGNVVAKDKIVVISACDSSPVRRYKEEKAGRGKLIDVTQGRKTRSVIFTTSDQLILSAVAVETLVHRLKEDQS